MSSVITELDREHTEGHVTTRVRGWTSADWLRHFEHRADSRPALPFSHGVSLNHQEQRDLLPSMAIFQRGESGSGRHLFRVAEQHARTVGDPEYVPALRQFIAEENTHGAMLGEYLDAWSFPRLTETWSDNGFRWLRHLSGLELAVSVLVTAEIIAMVYYAALRKASSCPVLRELCTQILDDEVFHLHFQGQRLGCLQHGRSRFGVLCTTAALTVMLDGAGQLVWSTHRPVFFRAGLSFAQYRHRLHRHGTIFREIVARNRTMSGFRRAAQISTH